MSIPSKYLLYGSYFVGEILNLTWIVGCVLDATLSDCFWIRTLNLTEHMVDTLLVSMKEQGQFVSIKSFSRPRTCAKLFSFKTDDGIQELQCLK